MTDKESVALFLFEEKMKHVDRPKLNLPPEELRKGWEKFLLYKMGSRPFYRPAQEILMTPWGVEYFASLLPEDYMKLKLSPKMEVFVLSLQKSIKQLGLIQRLVIRHYYGIEREQLTQIQIAKKLGLSSQPLVSKYLIRARRRLRKLVRQNLQAARLEHEKQTVAEDL